MSHRVRPLAAGDLPALEGLEQRCFSDPWTPAALAAALSHPHGLALALEAGTPSGPASLPVGFALGVVVLDEGELHTIAVDPDHQGRGLGRQLLQAFIRACRDRGAKRLFLEVRLHNTPALALYYSQGFRDLRRLADYYGPGQDGLALLLDLDSPAGETFS